MAVPLTSQGFADVLDPLFRDIATGEYDKGKSRIGDFFTIESSDKPTEKYSELTPMGKFQEFNGVLQYDGAEQGYDVTATHIEKALGVQIQRKLYDDDQHGVIADQFSGLGRSAFKTQEDDAADMFNSGFSVPTTFYSHTEGVALCSDSHTCPNGNISTTTGFDNLTTAELSPVSLTANIIQMRGFKDDAGDKIDLMPDELIIPIDLEDRAMEILKTVRGLDNADQTINVHEGRFKLKTWNRLTDTNNYFLCDSSERARNLIWFWRIKLELAKMESFDNIIAKGRGYMRYAYLRRSWRFILGAQVS